MRKQCSDLLLSAYNRCVVPRCSRPGHNDSHDKRADRAPILIKAVTRLLCRLVTEGPSVDDDHDSLEGINQAFAALSAPERVASALKLLPGLHVLSSSFGAQSAVMLHLVTRCAPDIPVVLID